MSGRDSVCWVVVVVSWGRVIGDLNRRKPWLKLMILGVIIIALMVTLVLIYRKKSDAPQLTAVAILEEPETLGGGGAGGEGG